MGWKIRDKDGNVIRTVYSPKPVEIDGVRYPKEIFTKWTPQELLNIGITLFTDLSREFATDYYTLVETMIEVGEFGAETLKVKTLAPKYTVAELSVILLKNISIKSREILANWDWAWVRQFRTGEPIADDISQLYTDMSTAIATITSAIATFVDMNDYDGLVNFTYNLPTLNEADRG